MKKIKYFMTILVAALFVVGCDKEDEVGQRLVNVEVYKVQNSSTDLLAPVQYNVYHDESLDYYSLITFSTFDKVTIGEYNVTNFADSSDDSTYSFSFSSKDKDGVVSTYKLFATTADTTHPGRRIGTMEVTVGEETPVVLSVTVVTAYIQITQPE